MEQDFWIEAWKEGRTGFHRDSYHPSLLKYASLAVSQKQRQNVLLPLCGKSLDLLWVAQHFSEVHGIEISQQAVESFFKENKLDPPSISETDSFKSYRSQNITLHCGDFFKSQELDQRYQLIFDRAALVALPYSMRQSYCAQLCRLLSDGGAILLVSFEYDQKKVDGPPFSVNQEEVIEYFERQNGLRVELLESQREKIKNPRFQEAGLTEFEQKTYLIKS